MPDNSFEFFLGRRRRACTDLLEHNEDVAGFMAALLEHLVDYSRAEGIPYKAIRLDLPFVTNDGRIVAQIRKAAPR
jgi:hypothetical protein